MKEKLRGEFTGAPGDARKRLEDFAIVSREAGAFALGEFHEFGVDDRPHGRPESIQESISAAPGLRDWRDQAARILRSTVVRSATCPSSISRTSCSMERPFRRAGSRSHDFARDRR
jgi:hypothetical protein